MKVLRFVSVGIFIWGLSLSWPEVYQLLTPPVMIGMILGLGASALAYKIVQRFDYRHSDNGTNQDHPSRPIPVVMTR